MSPRCSLDSGRTGRGLRSSHGITMDEDGDLRLQGQLSVAWQFQGEPQTLTLSEEPLSPRGRAVAQPGAELDAGVRLGNHLAASCPTHQICDNQTSELGSAGGWALSSSGLCPVPLPAHPRLPKELEVGREEGGRAAALRPRPHSPTSSSAPPLTAHSLARVPTRPHLLTPGISESPLVPGVPLTPARARCIPPGRPPPLEAGGSTLLGPGAPGGCLVGRRLQPSFPAPCEPPPPGLSSVQGPGWSAASQSAWIIEGHHHIQRHQNFSIAGQVTRTAHTPSSCAAACPPAHGWEPPGPAPPREIFRRSGCAPLTPWAPAVPGPTPQLSRVPSLSQMLLALTGAAWFPSARGPELEIHALNVFFHVIWVWGFGQKQLGAPRAKAQFPSPNRSRKWSPQLDLERSRPAWHSRPEVTVQGAACGLAVGAT
ncbi:WAS/WASL-interacting protein family member 3-like [Fukomys damarensis]|uniref:WAS/WASL-interacting protein family member 3-like n=1 Tax=Fukomys damarensis TaxID=885580 RepID=UPI00053F8BDD|nr:WAS/WASL-interacting protein family member 3-like [Fukomys damarensis]